MAQDDAAPTQPLAGSAEEKAMLDRQANAWKDAFHYKDGSLTDIFKMGVVSLKEYLKKFGCTGRTTQYVALSLQLLEWHFDAFFVCSQTLSWKGRQRNRYWIESLRST